MLTPSPAFQKYVGLLLIWFAVGMFVSMVLEGEVQLPDSVCKCSGKEDR